MASPNQTPGQQNPTTVHLTAEKEAMVKTHCNQIAEAVCAIADIYKNRGVAAVITNEVANRVLYSKLIANLNNAIPGLHEVIEAHRQNFQQATASSSEQKKPTKPINFFSTILKDDYMATYDDIQVKTPKQALGHHSSDGVLADPAISDKMKESPQQPKAAEANLTSSTKERPNTGSVSTRRSIFDLGSFNVTPAMSGTEEDDQDTQMGGCIISANELVEEALFVNNDD